MKIKTKIKNIHPLVIFVFFSLAIRFFSFFPSVIDHDESTYLVMADEMLRGKMLYVDIIDIKPAGIFLICALEHLLFGNSVFLFRFFTSLVVALTAFMIYKTKIKVGNSKTASIAGGIIYILLISIFTFYGLSVNTEHFFNLFTILALFLILNDKTVFYFLAGLSLGVGFIIKYFVLFDFMAFAFFLLILGIKNKSRFKQIFYKIFLIGIGLIIPFALLNIYYNITGYYKEFFFISYVASGLYPVERTFLNAGVFFVDFNLRFFPVLFLFYYVLFSKKFKEISLINEKLLIVLWVILDLSIIFLSGKPFGHYFLQLMIPVSFLSASFYDKRIYLTKHLDLLRKPVITAILLTLFSILSIYFQKKYFFDKQDTPREIAQYLKPLLKQEDNIYTGNYHHILYLLLDKPCPTKYVHRSLLFADHHIKALKIDVKEEVRKIILSNPKYIINIGDQFVSDLNDYIHFNYKPIKIFNDGKYNIYVFKRKDYLGTMPV